MENKALTSGQEYVLGLLQDEHCKGYEWTTLSGSTKTLKDLEALGYVRSRVNPEWKYTEYQLADFKGSGKRSHSVWAVIYLFTQNAVLAGLDAKEGWRLIEEGKPLLDTPYALAFNPVEIGIHPRDVDKAVAKWESSAAHVGRVFVIYREKPGYERYNVVYSDIPASSETLEFGWWNLQPTWWAD